MLYGLEGAQLIPSIAKSSETLQLNVLRKPVRLYTIHINRLDTNQNVFQTANGKWKKKEKKNYNRFSISLQKAQNKDTMHNSSERKNTQIQSHLPRKHGHTMIGGWERQE